MEDPDHLQKKLDLEFRKILRVIKPYIPCIMNNDYLFSYRMWLEKLSDADSSEKLERNNYLMELCKQIQDGVLEKPFDELPKPGSLVPFSSFKADNTDKEPIVKKNVVESVSEYESTQQTQRDSAAVAPKQNLEKPNFEVMEKNKSENESDTETAVNTPLSLITEISLNLNNSGEPVHSVQVQKIPHQKTSRLYSKPIKKRYDDDTSWYDLSELSSTTFSKNESGDVRKPKNCPKSTDLQGDCPTETYENKIANLMNIIVKLQQENQSLSQNAPQAKHMKSVAAETSMHDIVEEVKTLKKKLKDLTKVKNNQGTSSAEWQNNISMLTKKLHLVQTQNSCLKSEIVNLEKKLQSSNEQRHKELSSLKDDLAELHSNEIKNLNQQHIDHLTNIESRFNRAHSDKEDEISKQLNDVKNSYETRLVDLNKEFQETLQQKNQEIAKLENMIENQCKRMHDEVRQIKSQMEQNVLSGNSDSNVDKIVYLQKCIVRMDKLYKKAEKEFNRQINKLKREIGIRDKSLQLHLISQKAERTSSTNSAKQQEMDDAIMNLEERYRKLLDNQQTYFLAEKEQDNKLISDLKTVIAKYSKEHS